jgi:hypothetical protein
MYPPVVESEALGFQTVAAWVEAPAVPSWQSTQNSDRETKPPVVAEVDGANGKLRSLSLSCHPP